MRLTLGVMKVNLLLVLLFALVFNWPIFLHFYRILSALEHVKAGFVLSIPLVLVAALNAVFLPFTFRYLLKPFFALLILTGSLVSYAMLKYGVMAANAGGKPGAKPMLKPTLKKPRAKKD